MWRRLQARPYFWQAEAHVIVRFNPGNVRTYNMER